MWRKQLCRHKGQWKNKGKMCFRHQSRDSLPAHGEDHGDTVVLLHPIEVHSGEDIQPTVHGKPALKQVPGRIYDPMKRTLKQVCWICDPMRDPCWSSWILKDCTPWKGPTLEQFLKSCNLWEGPILEKFVKDSILHVPTPEQRNSIRTKEWQKRSFMNWL